MCVMTARRPASGSPACPARIKELSLVDGVAASRYPPRPLRAPPAGDANSDAAVIIVMGTSDWPCRGRAVSACSRQAARAADWLMELGRRGHGVLCVLFILPPPPLLFLPRGTDSRGHAEYRAEYARRTRSLEARHSIRAGRHVAEHDETAQRAAVPHPSPFPLAWRIAHLRRYSRSVWACSAGSAPARVGRAQRSPAGRWLAARVETVQAVNEIASHLRAGAGRAAESLDEAKGRALRPRCVITAFFGAAGTCPRRGPATLPPGHSSRPRGGGGGGGDAAADAELFCTFM